MLKTLKLICLLSPASHFSHRDKYPFSWPHCDLWSSSQPKPENFLWTENNLLILCCTIVSCSYEEFLQAHGSSIISFVLTVVSVSLLTSIIMSAG